MPDNASRQPNFDRVAILAEGSFEPEAAKTATGIMRYSRATTVAIIDSTTAGQTARQVVGVGDSIPVVVSIEEAIRLGARCLVVGIAPRGGELPGKWRTIIGKAIDAGLDIASGLHSFIGDDSEFAAKANNRNVTIWDARRPPKSLPVSGGKCVDLQETVVLTIGTDCCVGKMTVSLELTQAAFKAGLSADFVPTGQTGIMIWGSGISVDAVVADFIAGSVEQMVLEASTHANWIFVEGQGSLYHPGYSGVTMGLIHGCMPRRMILCHKAARTEIRGYKTSIPPLSEVIEYHESICRPLFPTKIAGIALNTFGMANIDADAAIHQAEDETGIPVDDCVRNGGDKLLLALMRSLA